MSKENAINYIKSLVEYTNCLENQKHLGKLLIYYNSKEIRQLIYKKHRIIYCIVGNTIFIISIIHSIQSTNAILNSIINFFHNID